MHKSFIFSSMLTLALLVSFNMSAMEKIADKATEVAQESKTESVKNANVEAQKGFVTAAKGYFEQAKGKMNGAFAYVKDAKARGWSKLTTKEKTVTAVITVAAAAALTYGIYKIYTSMTAKKEKKNVASVRVPKRA